MTDEVRLRVTGDTAVLEDLQDWLRREPELRGRVRHPPAPVSAGEMGGLSDTLVVALGSGGAISVLLGSVQVWLQRRRDVSVEVCDGDGRRVALTAQRAADAGGLPRGLRGGAAGPEACG
ncbi:hypothetical protein K1W54_03890, partial [Micromonospora sp. CPCC 205371]|nr:hypothetical protein [Micromonospora sp. CPCC 205371]